MKIHSLAVSGLVTLNLHSLNNEGAEGNYLQTREVQVVDSEGKMYAVNAISGDMFKHIQAEHLYNLATEKSLPLCGPCQKFDANRIVADTEFAGAIPKDTPDNIVLSEAIKKCIIDDAEGILITSEVGGKKRAIGRKSVLEFGWVVGRPDVTKTESYFHVKYAPEGRGKGSGDESGANTGQNIFHRPASSGQYAVVLNIDLFRVGRNDINLEYVLPDQEREKRIKAVLQSVLFTFLKPNGAHRNTQNPHIVNFEGIISVSTSTVPAPVASALNPNYEEEIKTVKNALDKLHPQAVTLYPFNSLGEFAEKMGDLILQVKPYEAM
ncbi:DevR family CRISPR-associated autoregulator [Thermanaerosceptrum fracticalcis]|uniref:DevR family CRISPR-associated autoregulator n=1 Tax=Thermanaerosceptrum fracticalcis TaxID=1712410 RepID=A0A7G6E242_THEFR|nr:DevR family CRISPR-associated autoregulator [Thermanaerosceptrum fracticalcis]QNB46146.1 DevR family CRISPR-associated autoregulator [Thermanaerosceptrum fracticalcis]